MSLVNVLSPLRISPEDLRRETIAVDPWGRCPWLQRLLFRALKALGAAAPHAWTVTIDIGDLERAVAECERAMWAASVQGPPRYLVVGRDHYRRLVAGPERPGYHALDLDADGRFRFRGLKVVFVPWVTGMCLLPDLD